MSLSLPTRHGHWFNKKLLTRSLRLFDDDELASLQRDLEDKLADVRVRSLPESLTLHLVSQRVDASLLTTQDEIRARQRATDKPEGN